MATDRLQRFLLDGIRDTGIEIGRGSYAVVKELDFRGLKCVGKEIHSLLYEEAAPRERADMLQRFEEECELLGRLHHPNVVQFLGVHVGASSGLPALVMEYLPATLSGCLDSHGVLPTEISLGILRDVALGLRYLHEYSPPITHRDLSANNVLLTTSMSAKISDLGVAKILGMSPAARSRASRGMTQTQVPGTPCYMPPETMVARPKYTSKVDIFSMGVLIVHVLSGEWPIPSEGYTEDPQNPDSVVLVMEFDRRCDTIDKIESGHPLLGLIRQCLSNIPSRRPDAVEVVRQVKEVCSQVPPSPENRLELLQQVQSLRVELQQSSREENEALRRENETLRTECEPEVHHGDALCSENQDQSLRKENETLQAERGRKDSEISSLRAEIERMRTEMRQDRHGAETQSPTGLSIHTRLQWKYGAARPVITIRQSSPGVKGNGEMSVRGAVVIGERVFVIEAGSQTVYWYDWRRNTWGFLASCPVRDFGMAQFLGKLITVGGYSGWFSTGKVYQFNDQTQRWEEFLSPMPTARHCLTVATRNDSSPKPPAIVACGGVTANFLRTLQTVDTVEVYSAASSQWHTAASLPTPCYGMTSVTVDDTYYVLGGIDKCCFSIPFDSFLDYTTSPLVSQFDRPVCWKAVADTVLTLSAVVSLRGSLVAIGGKESSTDTMSSAIHILTNGSWERVSGGDLPQPRHLFAAVCLPSDELLVIGGQDSKGWCTTSFIASIVD